jgi:hypothetical protein
MRDQSHGVMVFDGKYKVCIYAGHEIAEIYDLENDPGEYDNLWLQEGGAPLKLELLHRAISTYMSTSGAGIERTGAY